MRVIVFPGNYFKDNLNLGDLAIYQALLAMMPETAELHFLTCSPAAFRDLGPRARTLTRGDGVEKHGAWSPLVKGADLALASGGSYFSELFPTQTQDVLSGLQAALELGIQTAVVGAAIEPLRTKGLLDRARAVLPNVGAIWVRDPGSIATLARLGVRGERTRLIADPSLALCDRTEAEPQSEELGVNLRDSPFYNPLPFELRQVVRLGVRAVTRGSSITVRALPVSLHGPCDEEAIRAALPETTPGSARSVDELLTGIARCRVVVSGSHHSAALALGCGVPALMVGASAHYLTKLRGLASHFGDLAPVVDLASSLAIFEIEEQIRRLWSATAEDRLRLRATAREHAVRGQVFVDGVVRSVSQAREVPDPRPQPPSA